MTPLQETRKLQARVKRTAAYDPSLSMTRLMKRFGINRKYLLELLGEDPAMPPAYRRASRRIRRDVDEVAQRKEAGDEFCTKCGDWYPKRQFSVANNSNVMHNAGVCVGSRRE